MQKGGIWLVKKLDGSGESGWVMCKDFDEPAWRVCGYDKPR